MIAMVRPLFSLSASSGRNRKNRDREAHRNWPDQAKCCYAAITQISGHHCSWRRKVDKCSDACEGGHTHRIGGWIGTGGGEQRVLRSIRSVRHSISFPMTGGGCVGREVGHQPVVNLLLAGRQLVVNWSSNGGHARSKERKILHTYVDLYLPTYPGPCRRVSAIPALSG